MKTILPGKGYFPGLWALCVRGWGLEARNAVLSRYLGPLMVDFIPESHGDLPSKLSMVADITKNWNLRLNI